MGHARYIGRVGGLAVALGVGVAVATTPGVAWADEGSAGSDASASTSTADTTSGATAGGTTTGSLTGAAGGSSADPSADGGDDSADAGESAESGASTGGMQVDASGGAITSTTPGSAGAAADEDVDADADGADTTVEGPAVEKERESTSKSGSDFTSSSSTPKKPKRSSLTTATASGGGADAGSMAPRVAASDDVAGQLTGSTAVGAPGSASLLTAFTSGMPAPRAAQSLVETPAAPNSTVSRSMSTMLSWVGLAPSAEGDAPELPADSPLLLAGLAAFRRQTQQALSGDEALASAVADPSQSSLMMAKADTGTAQPMTMAAVANSAPVLTGVTQDSPDQSTGTITGAVTATDQDDNPLLYSLSGPQPAGGSVTVNADGTFIYTPSESARLAAGPYSTVTFDRFTVAVGDGQAITTTDVSVPVLPTRLNNEDSGVTGANPYGVVVVGRWAYVANQGANTVTAIDTLNPSVSQTITVGIAPTNLVASPVRSRADVANRLYVSNRTSGTVSVINTLTNTVIDTIPATTTIDAIKVGSRPESITINADGTRVYVANSGSNNVSVIDTTSMNVIKTIAVGANPRGIAFAQTVDGPRVYVVNTTAGTVSVINTATNTLVDTKPATQTIDPIRVGSTPQQVAISPDGKWAYVTNYGSNSVSVIKTATNTVDGAAIPVGSTPVGVAVSADGSLLYVANGDDRVTIFDTRTRAVHSVVQIDQAPELNFSHTIALAPDGSLYVTDYADHRLRVVSSRRGNTAPVAIADPTVDTDNQTNEAITGWST